MITLNVFVPAPVYVSESVLLDSIVSVVPVALDTTEVIVHVVPVRRAPNVPYSNPDVELLPTIATLKVPPHPLTLDR